MNFAVTKDAILGSLEHFQVTVSYCGSRVFSLYAFTKYAQEMMLKTMCPAMGIDYTIFRFQNVYGVGQMSQPTEKDLI